MTQGFTEPPGLAQLDNDWAIVMQGHHAKRVSYSDFEHWWKVTAIRLLRCRATCIYAHTMLLQRNRPPQSARITLHGPPVRRS